LERGGADEATMAIGLDALLWVIGLAPMLPAAANHAIGASRFQTGTLLRQQF
jgi:hypothetical protein